MNVELNQEELGVLIELVDRRIEDLGPEIRHCRTPHYHDALKLLRDKLKVLRKRLAALGVEAG